MDKQAKEELAARTVVLNSHEYQKRTLEIAEAKLIKLYAKESRTGFTSTAPKIVLMTVFAKRKAGLIRAFAKDVINQVKIIMKFNDS